MQQFPAGFGVAAIVKYCLERKKVIWNTELFQLFYCFIQFKYGLFVHIDALKDSVFEKKSAGL